MNILGKLHAHVNNTQVFRTIQLNKQIAHMQYVKFKTFFFFLVGMCIFFLSLRVWKYYTRKERHHGVTQNFYIHITQY